MKKFISKIKDNAYPIVMGIISLFLTTYLIVGTWNQTLRGLPFEERSSNMIAILIGIAIIIVLAIGLSKIMVVLMWIMTGMEKHFKK